MFQNLRRSLGWKLFFSYLVIILIGVLVLATTAEFVIPSAFDRHMGAMMAQGNAEGYFQMGGMMGQVENDLFINFRRAVNEALFLAALAAVVAAGITSVFVTRQVIAPVQAMTRASQQIANGKFEERVPHPNQGDELAQLAISFNHMAAQLEKTEAMRGQLIGDVAHELRTPLTTIKGSLEGLMDGVLSADETTFLQLYREADRLQRLVNDLQELSLVEARAYELHPRPIGLGALIRGVVSRLGPQYDEKGVGLRVEVPSDLPLVMADEDRLTQILTNLLGNALHYTPEEGRVEILAEQKGREIQVTVSDTGIGIPAEHLPHVFDRFYRVDKSRSRAGGGSGIGLTIAKHLVEVHEGRIWVQSEGVGKGSQFTFTLTMAR
jgi:signal transduction histidine kinase